MSFVLAYHHINNTFHKMDGFGKTVCGVIYFVRSEPHRVNQFSNICHECFPLPEQRRELTTKRRKRG